MNKLLFIIINFFVTKNNWYCKYETKTTISWWQITEWVIHQPTNGRLIQKRSKWLHLDLGTTVLCECNDINLLLLELLCKTLKIILTFAL